MVRIVIVNDGTVRNCEEGANLLAELLRAGAFVDNPCNGTGICGKCKVRIVDGGVESICDRTEITQSGGTDAGYPSGMYDMCFR